MKFTGAEIIIRLLRRQKITTISGIPGGANLPIYRALYGSGIAHILARHEQGAGFIAQGMARATGEAAVCMATSGPGATNLLTALADAKMDSIPIIAFTGQVPADMLGTDAFQEIDTYGLTLPITKHNFLVRSAGELLEIIPKAFSIAVSGRPGPIAIDIPKNVQLEELEVKKWPCPGKRDSPCKIKPEFIRQAAEMMSKANKPLFYIGGGIIHARAQESLIGLARKSSVPVVSSLMGLGSFPSDDPLFLGMLGMHGTRTANLALKETDMLLAIGVRFDDRATGNIREFCPRAIIIHIDIDPAELNKIKEADLPLAGDINSALLQLTAFTPFRERKRWLARINRIRREGPGVSGSEKKSDHPVSLISLIGKLLAPDTIITTDVGQHQMWVAREYPFRRARTLITSGGLGTMGFGLPAAIGAALACPDKQVVCISGDGSMLMNIQELATLADLKSNVKIIIFNNGHLGLVRQQQELFYDRRFIGSRFKTNPDFAGLARNFGINGYNLTGKDSPSEILTKFLSCPGPALINIPIDFREKVIPMVRPGRANHEMIEG